MRSSSAHVAMLTAGFIYQGATLPREIGPTTNTHGTTLRTAPAVHYLGAQGIFGGTESFVALINITPVFTYTSE